MPRISGASHRVGWEPEDCGGRAVPSRSGSEADQPKPPAPLFHWAPRTPRPSVPATPPLGPSAGAARPAVPGACLASESGTWVPPAQLRPGLPGAAGLPIPAVPSARLWSKLPLDPAGPSAARTLRVSGNSRRVASEAETRGRFRAGARPANSGSWMDPPRWVASPSRSGAPVTATPPDPGGGSRWGWDTEPGRGCGDWGVPAASRSTAGSPRTPEPPSGSDSPGAPVPAGAPDPGGDHGLAADDAEPDDCGAGSPLPGAGRPVGCRAESSGSWSDAESPTRAGSPGAPAP